MQTLKQIREKELLSKEQYRRAKVVIFSKEDHPLRGKMMASLEGCTDETHYAGCATALQNTIEEERFSFCMDVIGILITDKSSETFRRIVGGKGKGKGEERVLDLETIKRKLEAREYPSPQHFTKDIQLLLTQQLEKNPSTQLVNLQTKFEGLVEYIQ